MERTVWIAEEEDLATDLSDNWLIGTFEAYVDSDRGVEEKARGLGAEEAVAWGRTRARQVYIRLGDSAYFSAGETPHPEMPPWPAADLPRLVRRRPAGERWKDRTPADGVIDWNVVVHFWPKDSGEGASLEELGLVHRAVAAAADVPPGPPARIGTDGVTWTGWWDGLVLPVQAATREQATERALARCRVPSGWTAAAMPSSVRPA